MKVKNTGRYNSTYTRTKKMTTRRWDSVFTNFEMHTSFFDSARSGAWETIEELGERLKWTLHNTQKDLKEEKEDTSALKETISQLQSDMVQFASELSVQGHLITTKDDQIADLKKQIDRNNGSTQKGTKKR
jgi:chromosome segregation ATPase